MDSHADNERLVVKGRGGVVVKFLFSKHIVRALLNVKGWNEEKVGEQSTKKKIVCGEGNKVS